MKLVIINGSPRGRKSNSRVLTNWIAESIENTLDIHEFFAIETKKYQAVINSITDDCSILIAFPLYTDSMPAILKQLLEAIEVIKGKRKNVRIYYIVQSGFTGANHCRFVEKYLVYYIKYMGYTYMGTAVSPAGEGLRLMPKFVTRNVKNKVKQLADNIKENEPYNKRILAKLTKREKPNFLFCTLVKSGHFGNGYFKYMLRKNKVYDIRYNKPYQ
jgi:NAD(P)H-dependent FMN reductase